jgi:hypothetical protein
MKGHLFGFAGTSAGFGSAASVTASGCAFLSCSPINSGKLAFTPSDEIITFLPLAIKETHGRIASVALCCDAVKTRCTNFQLAVKTPPIISISNLIEFAVVKSTQIPFVLFL